MNELTEICRVASVDGYSLSQLRDCLSYSYAFKITLTEWIIIGIAALLGMKVAVIGRKEPLAALEGLLLGALAAYGGITGGQLFAQCMPPLMMGIWLSFVVIAAIFFLILGLINGNADVDWKVLGSVEIIVLIIGFIFVAILCFKVPARNAATAYTIYLDAVTWLFATCAILDMIIAATYGSYHWGVGWLLVPLNASWGALGNHLGIFHHSVSWHMYANHGTIRQANGARKFYTHYGNGLRLKDQFAFTLGAVMTGPPVEEHEAQHVLQHFIFGPIFTVSYLIWFIPGAFIGFWVGLAMGKGFAGIEAWAYYNNPWEIWAYEVEGDRKQNGDDSLIWSSEWSWSWAILYYLGAIGIFLEMIDVIDLI